MRPVEYLFTDMEGVVRRYVLRVAADGTPILKCLFDRNGETEVPEVPPGDDLAAAVEAVLRELPSLAGTICHRHPLPLPHQGFQPDDLVEDTNSGRIGRVVAEPPGGHAAFVTAVRFQDTNTVEHVLTSRLRRVV